MNLLPKSIRRMKPHDQVVTLALGGAALIATGYVLHRLATSRHTSLGTRIAVSGPAPWAQAVAQYPKLGKPFSATVKMSVKGAQRALNDLHHAGLTLSNKLDANTIAALKNFQAEQGLPATGKLDAETSNALLYLASMQNPAMRAMMSAAQKPAPVTYSPYPMPSAPAPITYAPYPMPSMSPQPPQQPSAPPALTPMQEAQLAAQPGQMIDLGSGWVAIGNCACQATDQNCIASCQGQTAASGLWDEHVVGAQSTLMYDGRFHYNF